MYKARIIICSILAGVIIAYYGASTFHFAISEMSNFEKALTYLFLAIPFFVILFVMLANKTFNSRLVAIKRGMEKGKIEVKKNRWGGEIKTEDDMNFDEATGL